MRLICEPFGETPVRLDTGLLEDVVNAIRIHQHTCNDTSSSSLVAVEDLLKAGPLRRGDDRWPRGFAAEAFTRVGDLGAHLPRYTPELAVFFGDLALAPLISESGAARSGGPPRSLASKDLNS